MDWMFMGGAGGCKETRHYILTVAARICSTEALYLKDAFGGRQRIP
jgi:hypothetical protein